MSKNQDSTKAQGAAHNPLTGRKDALSSDVPPPPDAARVERPDMVPLLLQTNESLQTMRYNLARACDDLAAARETALTRPWRRSVRKP